MKKWQKLLSTDPRMKKLMEHPSAKTDSRLVGYYCTYQTKEFPSRPDEFDPPLPSSLTNVDVSGDGNAVAVGGGNATLGDGNAVAVGKSYATTGKEGGWSITGVLITLVLGAAGIIASIILAK